MKRYILNTNSKRIHDLKYADGRCKIDDMNESYKISFDSLDDALNYPDKDNPLARQCTICIKNKEKNKTNNLY